MVASAFRLTDKAGVVRRFVMACPRDDEYTGDPKKPQTDAQLKQLDADSTLAAAAPEMYEALRRYVEISYECHAALNHGAPKDCCGFAQNISDARAALAKAEGR